MKKYLTFSDSEARLPKLKFQRPSAPLSILISLAALMSNPTHAADQFFAGDGSAFTASKWGSSAAGPFASTFTSGNVANFAVVNGTASGAGGITVGGLNATENLTYSSSSTGTLLTGGTVAPVTVAAGKTLDLSSLAISAAAGVGFTKNGTGVFAMTGNTYTGGFTLNAGTFVCRGVNAMGAGALNINGGTIAASATRDFTGKFTGGITIGGDFQLGALSSAVAISSDTANMGFSNNISLGAATRTITIGANGTYTLGGVISGGAGAGLTINALSGVTGTLLLANVNTYSGNTTISGGTLSIGEINTVPAKLGNGTGTLVLNGGTLFRAPQNTVETHPNPISLTDNSTIAGNPSSTRSLTFSTGSISLTPGKTLTIRSLVTGGVFEVRLIGGGFDWTEPIVLGQTGEGTASLGPRNDNTVADQTYSGLISGPGRVSRNVSTSNPGGNSVISNPLNSYTGGTEIRGGFIGLGADNPLGTGKITIGSDPNALGIYASGAARLLTNAIIVDPALTAQTNFQVRGSQDITLAGSFTITNTMFLSVSNSALTTFSGVISNSGPTGGIAKLGFGKVVFSGSNVYSGLTTIRAGTLLANNTAGSATSTGAVVVVSGGTLGGTGVILGAVTNGVGATLQPGLGGTNTTTLTISNTLGLAGNSIFVLNRNNAQINSRIAGLASVRYGGTLTVTNAGPPLQAGDTFTLFSSLAYAGTFSAFTLPALDPGLVWNTNNLTIDGSISVQSTTTTTVASSSNPGGFQDSISFTANVTPAAATGSVVFFIGTTPFSTNSLAAGTATSSSITSLPRGTNLVTALYGGAGSYLPSTNSLNQIVTNHPPTLATINIPRTPGIFVTHIKISDVLAGAADSDGDTFSLTTASASTNGVSLVNDGTFLHYFNTNSVSDQFLCTITDSYGESSVGTVNLTLGAFPTGQNTTITVSGSTATVGFVGIPGYAYGVHRSTNLVDWVSILVTNAPATGAFQIADDFNDLGGVPSSAYYRLQWNP